MADALRKEPGLDVQLIDGDRGEFTVSVDGHQVASKGLTLPDVNEVVEAVRHERGVGAK